MSATAWRRSRPRSGRGRARCGRRSRRGHRSPARGLELRLLHLVALGLGLGLERVEREPLILGRGGAGSAKAVRLGRGCPAKPDQGGGEQGKLGQLGHGVLLRRARRGMRRRGAGAWRTPLKARCGRLLAIRQDWDWPSSARRRMGDPGPGALSATSPHRFSCWVHLRYAPGTNKLAGLRARLGSLFKRSNYPVSSAPRPLSRRSRRRLAFDERHCRPSR